MPPHITLYDCLPGCPADGRAPIVDLIIRVYAATVCCRNYLGRHGLMLAAFAVAAGPVAFGVELPFAAKSGLHVYTIHVGKI